MVLVFGVREDNTKVLFWMNIRVITNIPSLNQSADVKIRLEETTWDFFPKQILSQRLKAQQIRSSRSIAGTIQRDRTPNQKRKKNFGAPNVVRSSKSPEIAGIIYRIAVWWKKCRLTSFVILGMRSEGNAPKNGEPTVDFSITTMARHTVRFW